MGKSSTMGSKQSQVAGVRTLPATNRTEAGMQLIDLERHADVFGGAAGVTAFVAILLERFKSPGGVYLCVGEMVLARVTSRMDARAACQARVAARLAANPKLLDKLKDLIETDDFHEEGTFSLDGGDGD